MTPHELGLMTKQAVSVNLIRRAATAANRAGKFSGAAGTDRLTKFTNRLARWIPGANDRAIKGHRAAGAKVPVPSSYINWLTESANPPWYKPWKAPQRVRSAYQGPYQHLTSKAERALRQGLGPATPDIRLFQKEFGNPPGFSYDKGINTVDAVRNSMPTLLHELGHANTLPKLVDIGQGGAMSYKNLSGAGIIGRHSMILEALANRRAIKAVRKLQGKLPGMPTVAQYKSFAKPQYEAYKVEALAGRLTGRTPKEQIPAWIKRMGLSDEALRRVFQ
jgi:hypothetical protein